MALDYTDYTNLYNFVTETGVVVPKTSDVKSAVQTRFRDIFGQDLDLSDETPVGRLVEAFTVLITTMVGVTAQNANQFNVNTATGIYLDSLAQMYGLTRQKGTYTEAKITVTATEAGCTIPAGARIRNEVSYALFEVVDAITVEPNAMTGTGTVRAVEAGPVSADAGQLTKIVTGTLGWLSVTNDAATTIGKDVETDEEFRARIIASRQIGTSFLTSIRARIGRVEGVSSCVVYENNQAYEVIRNDVIMPEHSVYICVQGGTAQDVAQAVVDTKPPGTGYVVESPTDDVTQEKVDVTGAGYSTTVYFYRPKVKYVHVKMTVDVSTYPGSDAESAVKSAVKAYFLNLGIGDACRISKLSLAISNSVEAISIVTVAFGTDEDDISSASVSATGYELLRTDDDYITVEIGES